MRSEMYEYRDHTILLQVTSGAEYAQELLVDGRPVDYGRLTDGRYVLDEYGDEAHDNLLVLAQRYIDRRDPHGRRPGAATPADQGE